MKRVVILGLARTGAAVARVMVAEGHPVLVVDRADDPVIRERAAALPPGVEVQLGGYGEDVARDALLACPSPGVPWDAPELMWARAHGVPVRSEMDLVFERCRGRVVGITGTNGKTTTTALVAAILERSGAGVVLGGNIGVPVLDRLTGLTSDDWVVLELSSFQIETVAEPRCSIACVLNVTPDHLDRHAGFEEYAQLKERIVRFAVDDVVLGYDDPITRAMAAAARCPVRYFGVDIDTKDGATVRDGDVVSVEAGAELHVLPSDGIPLFGEHNVLNVLAAAAVARAAGVAPTDIAVAVRGFHAVPHRLEVLAERDGVLWINDSKATNAESTIVALRAFGERPIIWIGGGSAANTSVDALAEEVALRARHAVLNGESAPAMDAALARRGFEHRTVVTTLADAVLAARDAAGPGDVVLLAPGFKSFDQFRDFEERGDAYRTLVASVLAARAERS